MISLGVPYLEYSEIASVAASFLREKGLTSIPVDIEGVIDSVYRSNIIGLPGLRQWFDTDGYSSPDFTHIYVDDGVWKSDNRYRFTLAHELGHHLMHKKYLDVIGGYTSVKEWARRVSDIDPRDHAKMEFQAYCFAGLLLVPPDHLLREFKANLESLAPEVELAKRNGLKRSDYLKYVLDGLASGLSPVFQVSMDAMTRRIGYDCLDELIL